MTMVRILALLLWVGYVALTVVGFRLIVRGAQAAGHPDQSRTVVKGFRRLILGAGLGLFGLGFWLDNHLLHIIGAVFLFEEAIETGVMTLALKRKAAKK
jgi:hypothetical protein